MPRFFDVNCWLAEPHYWLSSSLYGEEAKREEIGKIRQRFTEAGIERAIVTHRLSLGYDWNIGNQKLLASNLCRGADSLHYAHVLTPDAWWTYDFDAYLSTAFRGGVRLFRLFPKSHFFYLNDAYMKRIFRALAERRFPVMLDLKQLDTTGNKTFDIDVLERVLGENRDLPLILEASLKQCMFSRYFFPLLEAFPNLSLETSGLILVDQIEGYVERYGAGRLVFGTGAPQLPPGISTHRLLLSDLDERDRESIAFGNLDAIVRGIEGG